MSRINTNVSSLVARTNLARSNADLQVSLTRLSTGLRINSGKDDPAGLIASNALGSDIIGTQRAISNSQQASQIVATAEGALNQVSKLLNDIRGLVTEAANSGALSADQIAANQLQVDSSLEAIDRIASTTSFQGKKLLDGSLGFITTSVSSTNIATLDIQQATIGTSGSVALTLSVTTAAAKASITGLSTSAALTSQHVIEVAGGKGVEVFTFGTGTTAAQIASAINLVSDATGVTADTSGATVAYQSQDYGSAQSVELKQISGTGFTGAGTRSTGTDVAGNVNGAVFTGSGLNVNVKTGTLALSVGLTSAFGTATGNTAFNITGGGANFQIGAEVLANQQVRIGIGNASSAELGGIINGQVRRLYEIKSGQSNDLDSNATTAFQIVDAVIDKISTLRGRLGALQSTTFDSNVASLNDKLTNLTQAQSQIRDADFAQETAALTRAQILVQSGTSVLQIANNGPQAVLALLPRG